MTKITAFRSPLTFVMGGLVGTGAALLFAPHSGKESRGKITGYASELKGRAQCYVMRGRDKVTGSARKTKDYFADRKSLISASFDAGKKAYVAEKNRLKTVH